METLDSGVAGLSALASHTCAVTQAGGLKCWGQNVNGQLGDGTLGNNRRTPDDVCADAACAAPLTGVAAVSAGFFHTCALMMGGGVKCWGSNAFGALGIGASDPDERPFAVDVCQAYDAGAGQCVELFSRATAVAAGGDHTCALMGDGGVKCWGINAPGSLGIGMFDPDPHPLPVDVRLDWDGDGCSDHQERGDNPAFGGQRDPKSFWDFFDVPDGDNVRNRAITAGDIARVVQRFGTYGDPWIDPLSPPPAPGYHTAFDRSPPQEPSRPWAPGPPDGSIAANDILFIVLQFGHSCV